MHNDYEDAGFESRIGTAFRVEIGTASQSPVGAVSRRPRPGSVGQGRWYKCELNFSPWVGRSPTPGSHVSWQPGDAAPAGPRFPTSPSGADASLRGAVLLAEQVRHKGQLPWPLHPLLRQAVGYLVMRTEEAGVLTSQFAGRWFRQNARECVYVLPT